MDKKKTFELQFVDEPVELTNSKVFSEFTSFVFLALNEKGLDCSGELTAAFVSDEQMAQFNLEYRGKNKVTDVLSFESPFDEGFGELVFCLSQIEKQAVSNSWDWVQEFCWLFLHGVLHLVGYDHEADKEAELMFKLQEDLFFDFFKG